MPQGSHTKAWIMKNLTLLLVALLSLNVSLGFLGRKVILKLHQLLQLHH